MNLRGTTPLHICFLVFAALSAAGFSKLSYSSAPRLERRYAIGVNYGQLGDNLPAPSRSVQLIKRLKAGAVKIYDANHGILAALANTNLRVTIMVPNEQIPSLGARQDLADEWVKHNVSDFYPATRIRMVLVGNEILSDFSNSSQQNIWPQLVPAMRNIHSALKKIGLHRRIKVSTPHALNVFDSYVFPPSNGTFRRDISLSVMKPMLEFLSRSRSRFLLDAYPYFTWEANRSAIPLDFALFDGASSQYKDPASGLVYDNLLDVQLDSAAWAMSRLGYSNIKIVLSETGWPTKGGLDERGANVFNAATYNRRLVRRMVASCTLGTPLRRHQPIPTFIFALYNENLKPGPLTERNWGLLNVNKKGRVSPVYAIDLSGRRDDYPPLPAPPPEPSPGTLKLWCISNSSATVSQLQGGLDYACGQPGIDCNAVNPGGSCFLPNTTRSHASFAFNDYYSKKRLIGGSCDFSGAAVLTETDPSYGDWKYTPAII